MTQPMTIWNSQPKFFRFGNIQSETHKNKNILQIAGNFDRFVDDAITSLNLQNLNWSSNQTSTGHWGPNPTTLQLFSLGQPALAFTPHFSFTSLANLVGSTTLNWLVVEPTHLKNIRQNWIISPIFGMKIKKSLSCHHLVNNPAINNPTIRKHSESSHLQFFCPWITWITNLDHGHCYSAKRVIWSSNFVAVARNVANFHLAFHVIPRAVRFP